jgi:P4 family phage/plasmid primase-like protien
VPHSEDQLSRHILAGAYEAGFDGLPADSLLAKFLDTMFQDDPEKEVKIKLLQEVAGSALMGAGAWLPQPKAVVLYGRSANNGKSEYLTLIEGLANGASHIPAHQFDQEKLVIGLRGQLLNVANELTSAHAIASETFKSAITGETVLGRQLYKDVVEFKPQAQHVYACNRLPPFVGGIDRGCKRRLLVLEFIKSIPTADMIPNIAQKILDSEYSLLLNWAIAGASRRIAQKDFTIPDSSADTLEEWVRDTDSVRAWVRDRVKLDEKERPSWPGYKPSDAMDQFYMWAVERHYDKYRLPKLSEFTQRMIEMFPSCKRTKDSSRFRGITILSSDQLDETANQSDPRKPSATSRFADWLTAGDEEVAASGHGSQGNGVEG